MIQLAWRFLLFQRQSALAQWCQAGTADSRLGTPKTMIVALARELLIALWRFVTIADRRKTARLFASSALGSAQMCFSIEGGPHPNAYQRFDLPIRIPVSMGPRSAPLSAPSRRSFS
jgi:hypothetical protein